MANVGTLVNIATIARLADANVEQAVTDFGGMGVNADLAAALRSEAQERKAAVVKAAANEILNLSQNADGFIATQAQAKQALLEQISGIDKVCAGVARARQYGASSNNFLPLASAIGLGIPAGTRAELKSVPKDWTPTVA
jgi:hypothetical protein